MTLKAVFESPIALNDDYVFGSFASSRSLRALLYNLEGKLAEAYPSVLSFWLFFGFWGTGALGF